MDWERSSRDGRNVALEQQVANVAKSVEAAEALCDEIAELKAQVESGSIDFRLRFASPPVAMLGRLWSQRIR